jgi:ABC-type lipoprotein release transport system permease subunit
MRTFDLVIRSLTYYWRTNTAVVLGVATAVAVLAGALLVGDSVRRSLGDLVLQRLGRADVAVVGPTFFRDALAGEIGADPSFAAAFERIAPLIMTQGMAVDQANGRRALRVAVYGVDDRFWTFHDVAAPGPARGSRDALVSPALAAEIGVQEGSTVLLRVQKPSDIPIESLHGRKDDPGQTIRVTVKAVLAAGKLGEFSLQPQQGDVRAIFVPLDRIQADLDVPGRINTLLAATKSGTTADSNAALSALIRKHHRLEDVGLSLAIIESQGAVAIQSDAGLIDEPRAQAARAALEDAGMAVQGVLTYLANNMKSASGDIPYSLVAAADLSRLVPKVPIVPVATPPPIVLNDWAARELKVSTGDPVTLEYFVWEDPGVLVTRTTEFSVVGVVPIAGAAADRDLAPVYPGITEADGLDDWDPPFPIDLSRVRPIDEDYWDRYRATPKAFVPLEVGQSLWRSRYGALTSIRVTPPVDFPLADARTAIEERLLDRLDPVALGLTARNVRAEGFSASRGATDFGEYFTYFSFFLVVSALLLAGLFFKLGIEQRARELGLLRAVGFDASRVGGQFLSEAGVLALIGAALGLVGAIGYAALLMAGLRTWWVDAVGTTALRLHVTPWALVAGSLGVILAALVTVWWTLRSLRGVTERTLLTGRIVEPSRKTERRESHRLGLLSMLLMSAAVALTVLAGAGVVSRAGAFFAAGATMLLSLLCLLAARWRRRVGAIVGRPGWPAIARLGARNLGDRPGRSVLSAAVIAAAAFILVSVDSFRRDGAMSQTDRASGLGGYSVMVESLLPIAHDPASPEGRTLLGLTTSDVHAEPFRVRPGDDASCLNLYVPTNPRILGARAAFLREGRFSFQESLAVTDAERANPWLLLEKDLKGAIPVIADANSMTYVLHKALGDEITVSQGSRSVRMRFVAALSDSIFQSEIIMSERHFREAFPSQPGFGLMLVEAPPERATEIASTMENQLADFGADARGTAERLAEFHRVENTYLSTFQTLGGLGLLLGTVGLTAVLLRNVLERRRELALLSAVGYRGVHFLLMLAAENGVLLASGLAAGTLSALLAIAPAAADRGGRLPLTTGAALLVFSVLAVGVLSSIVAARMAARAPLIETLRSDH